MDDFGFVSGGYFIVERARRTSYMNGDLIPESFVTASDCLVRFVPDAWSFEGASDLQLADRQEKAARFGLTVSALESFSAWCASALDRGELGWLHVFLHLDDALRVKRDFFPRVNNLVVIGLALAGDLVSAFLEDLGAEAESVAPGIVAAIRGGKAPSPEGQQLGYDVLGWDLGGFHSYLCNGLETEFAGSLGIRPNACGLFDRLEDARRCADHCNAEATAAEPALWMPWHVAMYDG